MTGAPCRILIVDDNPESAQTLGWMVELDGHEYRIAQTSAAAIALAAEFLPHLVLLDISLPDRDGYDTCRMMKAMPELDGTVFAAQTGWASETHKQQSEEAGFHQHLVKPVSVDDLNRLIGGVPR